MKKYAYTLTTTANNASIHEFIDAKDVVDAYGKVLAFTTKLNKKNSDYVWTLQNIENAFFVGVEDEIKPSE